MLAVQRRRRRTCQTLGTMLAALACYVVALTLSGGSPGGGAFLNLPSSASRRSAADGHAAPARAAGATAADAGQQVPRLGAAPRTREELKEVYLEKTDESSVLMAGVLWIFLPVLVGSLTSAP
jgi:hypothetical protein